MIGDRIIKLRQDKGYSTTKLASLAGITQSTLREIEIGNTSPTWDTLTKICKALEIPVPTLESDNRSQAAYDTDRALLREARVDYSLFEAPDRILAAARRLTPHQQKLILAIMEEWGKLNRPRLIAEDAAVEDTPE